jgi:carbon storage regulator
MLVLSRRSQESINIQDSITIQILEIRGQSVKLGFSAPDDVAIHRSESVPGR